MRFSEVLGTITATDGGSFQVTVDDEWLQGRACFGGLIAGVGNETMRRLVPGERPLRSLQTTFVAPTPSGVWRVVPRVLRVGRAVTLAQCEIFAADQVVAVQVGVYGLGRTSVVSIKPTVAAVPRAIDDTSEVRFVPGKTPPFLQHIAQRWSKGAKPFSGTRSPSKLFLRHRDTAPLSESHVVALVDALPTPAMSMMTAPGATSSMVWTLEFFEHDLQFAPDAWWRIDTDIDAATEGYVHQTGLLIDPNGRPVALTRQMVAVFG